MEIISQQACEKCCSLGKCFDTAMYHPEQQIRCVHFGYITKQVNELTDTINNKFTEYIDCLLWRKEN
jgi:hypothetical protein